MQVDAWRKSPVEATLATGNNPTEIKHEFETAYPSLSEPQVRLRFPNVPCRQIASAVGDVLESNAHPAYSI